MLVAGAALLVAVPAGAAEPAKHVRHVKHKKVVHRSAKAAEPRCRGGNQFQCGPLYFNGNEYLGDDPDPNIRFQLWRDLGSHFGGESD